MKPKAKWYLLEDLCTETQAIKAEDLECNALGARLYDNQGNPMLIVFQFPLEAAHTMQLSKVRQVLQAQFETPVLILDQSFRAVKLREATDIEARRLEQKYKYVCATGYR